MTTIAITQLPEIAPKSILVIESLEGGKYLPRVRRGETLSPIAKSESSLLTFNSLRETLDALSVYDWKEKRLLQDTAYDEMIGNPTKSPTPLEIAI